MGRRGPGGVAVEIEEEMDDDIHFRNKEKEIR